MAASILLAFNRQLTLSEAYNWDRTKIYGFLNDILSDPVKFGTPADKMVELRLIKEELLRLCLPNGRDYNLDPRLRPNQHIFRDGDPLWPGSTLKQRERAKMSRFKLRRHLHNTRSFSNPYDLLGLFLSSLGPAPIGATRENFYLPLTAVYGRWCAQIAGRALGGVGFFPAVFQCTWRIADGMAPQFFLGSSVAGYTDQDGYTNQDVGTWREVVRKGRFDLLFPGGNFDQSPSRTQNGNAGSRFGSCAETHPFLELMKGSTQGVCYGIALKSDYFDARNYGENLNPTELERKFMGPCVNCQTLINLFNGSVGNFST